MNQTPFERGLDGLSDTALVNLYRGIADRYGEIYAPEVSMPERKSILKHLSKSLHRTGDSVIRLLKPNPTRTVTLPNGMRATAPSVRGDCGLRFRHYRDGMLMSEFMDLCIDDGYKRSAVLRQLQRDEEHAHIEIISV